MKNFTKNTKTILAFTLLISIFSTSKVHSKNADTDPPKGVVIVIKP